MKRILLSLMIVSAISCSTIKDLATGAAKGALGVDKGGIELDAQIGDRETETNIQTDGARGTGDVHAKDNAKVSVNTRKIDSNFEKAENVSILNEHAPPWLIIVAIMGWLCPTPWNMIKTIFKTVKGWFGFNKGIS